MAILLATPIDSRTVRIYVPIEPAARTPTGDVDDAWNRRCWDVTVVDPVNDPHAFDPEIEAVVRVEPAAEELATFGLTYPDAWAVDLVVARPLLQSEIYVVTGALTLRDVADAPLFVHPDETYAFPGIAARPARRPERVPSRTMIDLHFDTLSGRWVLTSAGDLATHGGADALKKRILRRMITSPGGFAPLPGYGLGLHEKKLMRTRERLTLRARAIEQVRSEPDVAEAGVEVVFQAGILFVRVRARSVDGEPLGLTLETEGEGTLVQRG